VLDTLHPHFHRDLKFHSETEFCQGHDFEDAIPLNLQMSKLGTMLSSWATEMLLADKKPSRVLTISHDQHKDDLD
jgi:hypothetical protein